MVCGSCCDLGMAMTFNVRIGFDNIVEICGIIDDWAVFSGGADGLLGEVGMMEIRSFELGVGVREAEENDVIMLMKMLGGWGNAGK